MAATDLTSHNTLRVKAFAKNFLELNSPTDIKKLNTTEPILFLGTGANILFTRDFPGTVAHINFSGIKVVSETDTAVVVEAAAGHSWHDLVTWSIDHNLSGLENLALIPGSVGAAVVGNIAAYGQNQADVVKSVRALNLKTQKPLLLSQSDCKFFYRESVFKHEFKNKILITHVQYRLSKTAHFDTSYHSRYETLEKILTQFAAPPYTIRQVFDAVVKIRTQKLPDWKVIPTAGSFFKNPFVSKSKLTILQKTLPDLQYYPTEKMLYPHPHDPIFNRTNQVKIPAGRLLDELGWRGKKIGRVGTFKKHALVIINLGGATGQEIFEYAETMRADIKKHFDINLEYEVQVI